MTRLRLFTVFHANFGFSSIPSSHYSRIIDRCFWPVLDLLEKYRQLRIGVELPAHSLALAAAEDRLFVEALRRLSATGQLEVVGSGLVQSILPLIPEAANRRNLDLGQDGYEALIGCRPVTAFANEQVWSTSLLDLYREAGFKAVVADWENSRGACGLPRELAFHPLRAETGENQGLTVLWNSTVGFQKFQRYLHAEVGLEEYLGFILRHWSPYEDRVFCLYGGDWEVIDYRPGDIDFRYVSGNGTGVEAARLERLVEALAGDERIEWVLPRQARKVSPMPPAGKLSSAENPLPTKKQPRYNPTRWAVSGRASPTANAECFCLYRALRRLEALRDAGFCRQGDLDRSLPALWEELCCLWGSDFRTHTTNEKWLSFNRRVGHALGRTERLLAGISEELAGGRDLALFNPLERDWEGHSFELPVHFAPGLIRGQPDLLLDGGSVSLQVEQPERYCDGSLRKALLVFCPRIPARGLVLGTFRGGSGRGMAQAEVNSATFETAAVRLALNAGKGGTIRSLAFPSVSGGQLAGTIEHGFLPQIDLSPDWYSGGLIIIDQNGAKITDLGKTSLHPVPFSADNPIRLPVRCRVESEIGPIWKTYYLYADEPRLDLRYHARFGDLRPKSFRLGILTVDPRAFERDSVGYSTVNGSREVESFPLSGCRVEHDQAVSFTVSARGCLGATEGWIDVADRRKGLAVIRDLSQLYTVPLVHYQEAEDMYLLRIYLSAGESDETSAVLWRGHVEVGVRYWAHGAGVGSVRDEAERCNMGLQVAWGRPDRVTG